MRSQIGRRARTPITEGTDMRITVTFEVDADLDQIARATSVNAATALSETLDYLRSLRPVEGQTFIKQTTNTSAAATIDVFPKT